MKKIIAGIGMVALVAVIAIRSFASEPLAATKWEYVTIRWDGRDNTHVVRPGGLVEFLGHELKKGPRNNGADERSFYMNMAMNVLAKEGYEIAAFESEEIVMKRAK
jgi:hypothetical protein